MDDSRARVIDLPRHTLYVVSYATEARWTTTNPPSSRSLRPISLPVSSSYKTRLGSEKRLVIFGLPSNDIWYVGHVEIGVDAHRNLEIQLQLCFPKQPAIFRLAFLLTPLLAPPFPREE